MTDRDDGAGAAIRLQGVGKEYVKLEESGTLLRTLLPFARQRRSALWALRDLDLVVHPGETVGVLGRNGAGKTTLLRLLAGVTRPSVGRVEIRGRVAPLISVGVGFNREMSGRENVFVNAMLLGLDRSEVSKRFDEIVDFAELEDFIDVPVKFYSSGMFMRLGFSVAVHTRPEVLLVDEVLAVGDLTFQLKCVERMRALQTDGTTILLVSHSVSAIRLLCPRAIVMRRGRIDFDGESAAAVARHHELLTLQAGERPGDDPLATVGGVRIVARSLEGPDGPLTTLPQLRPVRLRLRLRFDQPVDSPQVALTVVADNGVAAYQFLPTFGTPHRSFAAGEETDVEIDFVNRLAGGTYNLITTVLSNDGRTTYYQDVEGMLVYAEPRLGSAGMAELEAVVHIGGHDVSNFSPLTLGPRDGVQAP